MAEPIDMFELAKKLLPDIEENMPSAVREAFEGGKIKSIFRTGGRDLLAGTDTRPAMSHGKAAMPSSHYFLLDDGRAARYGSDDVGHGWMGARASVPNVIKTQDDPFVFDKILFGESNEKGLSAGGDISKSLPSGVSSEPIVGKSIYETFSKDGKIVNSHGGNAVKDIYRRDGTATFFDDAVNPVRGTKPNLVNSKIEDLNFLEKENMKGNSVMVPELKSGSAPTPAVAAPTPTSTVAPAEPASIRSRLRGTNITTQSAGLRGDVSHISGAKFEPLIPDMNINHGWKIHGDFVKDIASHDDALAKIGIAGDSSAGFKIGNQSVWDATAARLDKLGLNTATDSGNLSNISGGLLFKKQIETAPSSTQMVNGKPVITYAKFESRYSDPLDAISMMEVFDENQTQFKASLMYGEGREFTGYTQSIENRDKLISSLESRLGNRLEDVNPSILGGHQTEGATQLSQKITGRFTTEYTDIPGAGGTMDWASQNPAGSKGQAAIDNVMATNSEMRPYIHTGVIGDESAANLQKLTSDFPVFDEMLHGPKGYVSPYGTIEDTFSQQGYDYKTGAAVKSAPVTPQTPPVTPASVATANATKVTPLTGEYDTGATAAKVASGQPIVTPPPVTSTSVPPVSVPPPPRGPTIGTPTNVTTGASAQGPRAGKPVQPTGAAAIDTTLMSDAEKATMSGVKGGDGISVVDPGLGAKIKSNPGLTAREAMGTIGKEIKTFTKAQGKVNRKIAGQELSSAVAAGFKQSKNLRLLGLGALVGVGYGASRAIHRENEDLQS